MPWKPPFSEADARAAIAASVCWADALRLLGYPVKGANYRTLQRWARRWDIDTGHFDPHIGRRRAARTMQIPLDEVLVENSTYNRFNLKRRLLAAGLLEPVCELCGQGEDWHGRRMSLVLDQSTGPRTTTGSRTSAWSARTAPRHSIRIAVGTYLAIACVPAAVRVSYPEIFAIGTALRSAGGRSTGRRSGVCRCRSAARSSARHMSI